RLGIVVAHVVQDRKALGTNVLEPVRPNLNNHNDAAGPAEQRHRTARLTGNQRAAVAAFPKERFDAYWHFLVRYVYDDFSSISSWNGADLRAPDAGTDQTAGRLARRSRSGGSPGRIGPEGQRGRAIGR